AILLVGSAGCESVPEDRAVVDACLEVARDLARNGLRDIADERSKRFLGKVEEYRARCRGGEFAVSQMDTPWVDWQNYWATGDASSRSDRRDTGGRITNRNQRGIDGALIDLEYQRMELIKFNLFDNNGTYEAYVSGKEDGSGIQPGPVVKVWPEMRLPAEHPRAGDLRRLEGGDQLCTGEMIRYRSLTGICNDIRNPAMGSTGQKFARNVEFEATFPELGLNELARNRHGDRIGMMKPDPQVISRKLFTRPDEGAVDCNDGRGNGGDKSAACPYQEAPFFNVLAAFWIQFMTHDWFSHTLEGRNDTTKMLPGMGCEHVREGDARRPLRPEEIARLGCRPDDRMDAALTADGTNPGTFVADGREHLKRAYRTAQNHVTAWWDASPIYGFSERSSRRIHRDPNDSAKLLMVRAGDRPGKGEEYGYLPLFDRACRDAGDTDCDPIQPEWAGQEAAAFPDNWTIGMSFFHNLFVREHNIIVGEFRKRAAEMPDTDSGLRNPARPDSPIAYGEMTDEEIFEVARLIVAAEIAKIHTVEWTAQLLYGEPLDIAMNSNWSGLFGDDSALSRVIERIVGRLAQSQDPKRANQIYSALAAGPGIVGRGSRIHGSVLDKLFGVDRWDLTDPGHVNGGTNHFGSPFNFPEEFATVYRLHPMVPDLLEVRDSHSDPNVIRRKISALSTFRAGATAAMREEGMPNWALSMGRQRLGMLLLRNHPRFLQNLDLRPRMDSKIDVAALDIVRDREHGLPRFNEFRRQIGLRQITSFDDFIDRRPSVSAEKRAWQQDLVERLREVYGRHRCDASKIISTAQRDAEGNFPNDCLGRPDGSMVDNVEDVDVVVGYLSETTRPHGFAISETMFQVFILNASRRLYSDRFFTSSFRPEFYTHLGIAWVNDNGPTGKQWERGMPNGERREVMPLKRVMLRAIPELSGELEQVVNAFDPWARDRGEHYSLEWTPRADARDDESFAAP
ncbi:MAG: peroxidase family protein, partial [Acetobacterales bacterium]